MLDALKQELAAALDALHRQNFHVLNQGSITLYDRSNSLVVAQPAACPVPADPGSMLVTDFSGSVVEGSGLPCTALPAHLEIYRAFPAACAVVHSHGLYTTAWAQAGRDIPVYGTGHLEYFAEAIPCTRAITPADAENGYSAAAGLCVAEIFQKKSLNPEDVPAALVFQHGAFVWGRDADEAVRRCTALEHIAQLAWLTEKINADIVDTRGHITPRTP